MQTPPSAGVAADKALTVPSVAPATASGIVEALCEAASAASGKSISPSLYNADLAPTKRAGRSWTSYSIFTLWAN
ncbi:MAG TPA: NCS1 family nucleobase:cation symporter-1, partial [Arthrobacter sp.]|nr:NCS1 family nucleobase:cation symporter-1 [Arthrobacter sp.]